MSDNVRLFIGSSSNGEDAPIEAAYEYSIRQNCSREVDIVWMRQTNDHSSFWGGWQTERWSTPFSGFRWAIPEYCNFEGRAIYTDCDMINYRDMAELYEIDMQGKPLAARKGQRFGGHEFCVLVFDCSKFKNYAMMGADRMKALPGTHHRFLAKFAGNNELVHDLDPKWNCLDGEDYKLSEIYQLHFTNMATQPWKPSWYTGQVQPHGRPDVIKAYETACQIARNNGYCADTIREQLQQDIVKYNIIGK